MTDRITGLHRNPFYLLGATVRDDRRRIVSLAEERQLDLDHDECMKASADLLNPRARVNAEVSWLPGVAPRRAIELTEALLNLRVDVWSEKGLPTLARANLLAASFEVPLSNDDTSELAKKLVEFASVAAQVEAGEVLRDINEDRMVARLPLVPGVDAVEEELGERGQYYRSVVKLALDRVEPRQLVAIMTEAVDVVTDGGDRQAPALIEDVVHMFEVEVQQFLELEAANITALIEAIRATAPRGETTVAPLVTKLATVARNWDSVAQPIQLAMRSRGTEHPMSNEVGIAIRSLGVDLFNHHQMIGQAKRITELLQEVFAELPEFSERLENDAEALNEIEQSRVQATRKRAEWAREITYSVEIGMFFQDVLGISPKGLVWKGRTYPLESITRVRWGATRHSVNGIPTGTTYTICFGDAKSEAIVECRQTEVFEAFIPRLWKAVGVQLLLNALNDLRAGKEWLVGGLPVRDDGIALYRHNFWTRDLVVRPWNAIRFWTADGALNVADKENPKINASFSYIQTENVHVLEHILEMATKRRGLRRLSELLN